MPIVAMFFTVASRFWVTSQVSLRHPDAVSGRGEHSISLDPKVSFAYIPLCASLVIFAPVVTIVVVSNRHSGVE